MTPINVLNNEIRIQHTFPHQVNRCSNIGKAHRVPQPRIQGSEGFGLADESKESCLQSC
jgi:hypothetical protein